MGKRYNGKTDIKYSKPYDCLSINLERGKDIPLGMVDDNFSFIIDEKKHTIHIEIHNIIDILNKYDTKEKYPKPFNITSIAGIATPSYYIKPNLVKRAKQLRNLL